MKKLPEGISNFKTKNVIDMSYMFFGCSSLEELPDGIKDWNVQKVQKANYMFSGCRKLISIPDISEWDVCNLTYINGMFENCISLEKLFDTKKWEDKITKKIKQVDVMKNCPKLHLDKNYCQIIKIRLSKIYDSIKYKCFSKLYKPFIYLMKFTAFLFLAMVIFLLVWAIYRPFEIKEIKNCINNPDEYLKS